MTNQETKTSLMPLPSGRIEISTRLEGVMAAEKIDGAGFSRLVGGAVELVFSEQVETGSLPEIESLARETQGAKRKGYRLTTQGRLIAREVFEQAKDQTGSVQAASAYISEAYRDLRDNHPEISRQELAAYRLISASVRGRAQWEAKQAGLWEWQANQVSVSLETSRTVEASANNEAIAPQARVEMEIPTVPVIEEIIQLREELALVTANEPEKRPRASFAERVKVKISGAVEQLKQENNRLIAKRQARVEQKKLAKILRSAFQPSHRLGDTDEWRGMSKSQKVLTGIGVGAVASGVFCWLSPLIASVVQAGNYVGGDRADLPNSQFYNSLAGGSNESQPAQIKPTPEPKTVVDIDHYDSSYDPGLAYWGVPTEKVPDPTYVSAMPTALRAEYERMNKGFVQVDQPVVVEENKEPVKPEPFAFLRQALEDPGQQVVLVIESQFNQWNDKCPEADKFCAPLLPDKNLNDTREVDSKVGVVIPPLDGTPPDRGLVYVHNFYGQDPGDGRVGIDLRNFAQDQPATKLVIVDLSSQESIAEVSLVLDETIEIPRGSDEHTRMRAGRITIQNCKGVGKPMNGFLMVPGEV